MRELGLRLSAGVSFNKIFAKMEAITRNLTQLQLFQRVILKNYYGRWLFRDVLCRQIDRY